MASGPAINGSATSKQEIDIMTIANVSQGNARGLPPALRTAQDAIHFPEVQDMLRRLSAYQLGIFMPHMHDERTGQFVPLPDDVVQVEAGLEVTFHPAEVIARETERFLPVGWAWRAGSSMPVAACEMVQGEAAGDAEPDVKHKMARN